MRQTTRRIAVSLCFALSLTLLFQAAHAQTFTVIHSFSLTRQGGQSTPMGGLTIDRAGNLYGTTSLGGALNHCTGGPDAGCGTIFRLKNSNGHFVFQPLYNFLGGSDGALPLSPLLITASGAIYGTTSAGGGGNCPTGYGGCGTVFIVQPPPTISPNINSNWQEHVLYAFQGAPDGAAPDGTLALDQSGRIYGSTVVGGTGPSCSGGSGCGVVFRLARSGGGWNESVLYNFVGYPHDAGPPAGGVILDASGNVYGSGYGGVCCGAVWELLANSGWTQQILYSFTDMSDGAEPASAPTFDSSGNLYGTTDQNGSGGMGTVFELSSGTWAFNLLYSLGAGNPGIGVVGSPLIFDQAGNLYGISEHGGAYGMGVAFKLTPSAGGWTYTSLHDFCPDIVLNCTDGAYPTGNIVIDANGDLYGTTQEGGIPGQSVGTVWEITP